MVLQKHEVNRTSGSIWHVKKITKSCELFSSAHTKSYFQFIFLFTGLQCTYVYVYGDLMKKDALSNN